VKGGSLYGISTVERKDGGLGQLGLEVGAGGFASNAENPHDLSGLSDCMTLAGGSMSGTFCASKNEWNEYSGLWTLAVSFSAPMPGTITKQLDTINDFIPRGGQIAVAEAETVVTEFNVVDFIAEHFGDAILDAKESYDRAQRCGIFNLNWRC
jgi:hypothetical protein